jgi:hypothetical protein
MFHYASRRKYLNCVRRNPLNLLDKKFASYSTFRIKIIRVLALAVYTLFFLQGLKYIFVYKEKKSILYVSTQM